MPTITRQHVHYQASYCPFGVVARGHERPAHPTGLNCDEAIAEYLTAILQDDDPALLPVALGDIARARGVTEIAKAHGITREALYKALRADAQPRSKTVAKVCRALGGRLVAHPL